VTRATPPSVDDAALEHLERLARLVIDPAEREDLKRDLVELLGFVDSLLEADVDGVEEYGPGVAAAASVGAERADVVQPSLPSSVALAMAPEEQDGFFKVPRTVDEG
jgi:aspartyl-tRNA(Asn)/glutamyl-tRNA(Gln) amidotransferase subunit C